MATRTMLSDFEMTLALAEVATDQVTADQWEVLYSGCEGSFVGVISRHEPSGIHSGTFGGHLDVAAWLDESDGLRVFANTLNFIETLAPERFLWNFSNLRFIDAPAMVLFNAFHRTLVERARCALVPPLAMFVASTGFKAPEGCPVVGSVRAGLAWLLQEPGYAKEE